MSGKSGACGMTWREERHWAEVRALGYPYDDFTALDQCGDALGERVLLAVLEWACYGQNVQGIEMGRGKLAEAPRAWLAAHIVSTVRRGFEYGDDWNFRRLLEAAERTVPEALGELLALNKGSGAPDILDVLGDYLG